MNSCNFKGILLNDPTTRRDKVGNDIVVTSYFNLSVPRLVSKGCKYDALPMKAVGSIALTCEKYLKKGSEIAVTCRARYTKYKRGKVWKSHVIFLILELFFADGNTRQQVADGLEDTPELEEYNDIDFSALG